MTRFASAPWPLKAAYVGAVAASVMSLALGLAAAIALAGLKRLSTHLDVTAIPAWFWYFRGDPGVRRWLGAGMLAAMGVLAAAGLGVFRSLRPPLYGAARWASEADLRRGGFRAERGILIGRSRGRPLVFGGAEHVILYAPTRSGKGVGVVIPNLLTWPDSAVVLDVKRENWDATAGFRAAHGQDVVMFDPLDAEGRTARFNPLGHIDRGDPVAVIDELQKLAVMLFPPPPTSDPFWAEAARTGLIGVGALMAATPDIPFSLGAIYRELTEGDPRTRLPQRVIACAAAGNPVSQACASAVADFCTASENTFASIKQTITARMNLWLNPRVCVATEASDFDLRDLRNRRLSLYLTVSPDNLARVAPLYNLLLQQLIDLNTRERPTAERNAVPVLMVLDEFARLGHAAVVAHAFAYVAGYGLRLLPVLQSPAQLRAEYGPDLTEEIIANCGAEIAFAPKELKVAQDLSERLGFYTYAGRAQSRPSGLSSGRRSQTESDQRRALMLPQELIQMPPDRLLVLRTGLPAIRGRKIAYYRERAFIARVLTAPVVPPRPLPRPSTPPLNAKASRQAASDRSRDADLALVLPAIIAEGCRPIPEAGASPDEVEAWVSRFIDESARLPKGALDHGR